MKRAKKSIRGSEKYFADHGHFEHFKYRPKTNSYKFEATYVYYILHTTLSTLEGYVSEIVSIIFFNTVFSTF